MIGRIQLELALAKYQLHLRQTRADADRLHRRFEQLEREHRRLLQLVEARR